MIQAQFRCAEVLHLDNYHDIEGAKFTQAEMVGLASFKPDEAEEIHFHIVLPGHQALKVDQNYYLTLKEAPEGEVVLVP